MSKYLKINDYNLIANSKILIKNFHLDFKGITIMLGASASGKTLLLKDFSQSTLDTDGKVEFFFGKTLHKNNPISSYNIELQNLYKYLTMNHENEKQKLALIEVLSRNPDFLFIDDLDWTQNDLALLFMYTNKKNISVFYATSDINKTVFADYLIVLSDNKIAIEGETSLVYNEEKLMKLLGFNLPFYINMSRQLRYYGIIDKICFTKKELEANIKWQ